jgi:hypothetical protein
MIGKHNTSPFLTPSSHMLSLVHSKTLLTVSVFSDFYHGDTKSVLPEIQMADFFNHRFVSAIYKYQQSNYTDTKTQRVYL